MDIFDVRKQLNNQLMEQENGDVWVVGSINPAHVLQLLAYVEKLEKAVAPITWALDGFTRTQDGAPLMYVETDNNPYPLDYDDGENVKVLTVEHIFDINDVLEQG